MTFNYDRSVATAKRLIAKFGQSATLTQTANSGTSYNPTRVETDHTVKVAVLGYGSYQVDGSLVKQNDKMVYLSLDGLTVTPDEADSLTIGGVKHQLISIKTLSPGGTVVFYELQARI